MKHLKEYLFSNFSQSFFSTFLVLFFIASVILFIRISGVTFVVKMSFAELFMLYAYSLPTLASFTVPITIFLSFVAALARLSQEYELPVIFSLGFNPAKIPYFLLPLLLLVALFSLILSLMLVPIADQAYASFLNDKKNNININLRPAEFGQKLGNWLVYVESKQEGENRYNDIVMFSLGDLGRESFILSKEAWIDSRDHLLELSLFNGSAYLEEQEKIQRVDYAKMIIRNPMFENGAQGVAGIFAHWRGILDDGENRTKRRFSSAVLIALFPLLSLFFIPLFGIMHPRLQKNHAYFYGIGAIGIYYVLVYAASNYAFLPGLILVPILWLLSGYLLYRRFTAPYF